MYICTEYILAEYIYIYIFVNFLMFMLCFAYPASRPPCSHLLVYARSPTPSPSGPGKRRLRNGRETREVHLEALI